MLILLDQKVQSNYFLTLYLLSITILDGVSLSSSRVSAETTPVNASVNVPASCSLSGTGTNSHNADISSGTYQANIGTTTLKAACNDSEGFAIYAVGYTGDEIGEDDSNKLIGANTNLKISTGTATSGTTSNWAMKLTAVSNPTPVYPITLDNGYGSYSLVPVTYTKVAHRDSGTDAGANATGTQLTTTYASFISSTQVADNYSGKVKYTLVHPSSEVPDISLPCEAGKVCYYPVGGNVVGTMGMQDISLARKNWSGCFYGTDEETYCYGGAGEEYLPEELDDRDYFELLASNFSRSGYGFAGWSDALDFRTNPNAHFYGPQESITISNDMLSNGLSLYAVWIPSAGSLQDSTKVAELCGTGANALTTAPYDGTADLSSVSALTDQRDNETYAIAKLADGRCWMIENLRLEAENTRSAEKQALAQGYGTSTTYGNFVGLADAEVDFPDSAVANSIYYSGTQSGTATINIGTTSSPAWRMPRYNNQNNQSTSTNRPQNPASNYATNSTTNASMYSYGNRYTWAAAIADTAPYGSGDHGTTSLCPTGWRLPIGSQSTAAGSFGALSVALGGPAGGASANGTVISNRFRGYPNNFFYEPTRYWTSTSAPSGANVYQTEIMKSKVNPGNSQYGTKYHGEIIRCTLAI